MSEKNSKPAAAKSKKKAEEFKPPQPIPKMNIGRYPESRKPSAASIKYRITSVKQRRFLKAFARLGVVGRACGAAGIVQAQLQRWQAKDPLFRDLMVEAREKFSLKFLKHVDRLCLKGTSAPIFNGGARVGEKIEYPQSLIGLRLKHLFPEVGDQKIELAGKVEVEQASDAQLDARITALLARSGQGPAK